MRDARSQAFIASWASIAGPKRIVSQQLEADRRHRSRSMRRTLMSNASPELSWIASPKLPWECEKTRSSALITTSYDAAHVMSCETDLIPGFAVLLVDMSTTNVAAMYAKPGQYVFIKPWGDEDGLCEPYAMWTPPDRPAHDHIFVVSSDSHVGVAAVNGELLEVSAVYGEGFTASELPASVPLLGICTAPHVGPIVCAMLEHLRTLHESTVERQAQLLVLESKSNVRNIQKLLSQIAPSAFTILKATPLPSEETLAAVIAEQDELNCSLFVLHTSSNIMKRVSSKLVELGVPHNHILHAK
mmetsp:Transcript_8312/g.21874  ORF Transcript_8312/g.21874 Transcript_8312/m.21874 type:complete len:301 (+) Transcript_8312:62-964(+)|eukprot:CAMPEP_0185834290 /NCGR_PEP_ID=MMETSP1353-20130828/4961_1 /TAXON_ID=1077150 /ORGANISM="Erythrolobus australicus, Strain CCMP3124" /LENGTH=300 /DNA_ID=CAMNT_0028532697 /DNA_START=54 /DNA_END=956 /DNA_ORIENTATION=+